MSDFADFHNTKFRSPLIFYSEIAQMDSIEAWYITIINLNYSLYVHGVETDDVNEK